MLLQLTALPQVPGANGVVQAPSPQLGTIVGDVYTAGSVCVALELPMKAKQGGEVSPGKPLTAELAASKQKRKRPRRVCTMHPQSLEQSQAWPLSHSTQSSCPEVAA